MQLTSASALAPVSVQVLSLMFTICKRTNKSINNHNNYIVYTLNMQDCQHIIVTKIANVTMWHKF